MRRCHLPGGVQFHILFVHLVCIVYEDISTRVTQWLAEWLLAYGERLCSVDIIRTSLFSPTLVLSDEYVQIFRPIEKVLPNPDTIC
jgi:hypothetical protein